MHLSSIILLINFFVVASKQVNAFEQESNAIQYRRMDGEEGGIEWKGIFDTPESSYIWIAQKVDDKYADPSMKLAALPVDSASKDKLESVESDGETAMEANCTELNHGETIVPAKGKCYLLKFDENRWETTFPVNASATNAVAFFAQHLPTEFEKDTHYLKLTSSGEDIEPTAEEKGAHDDHADDNHDDKPWGKALGASVLVNLVTLSGVILAIPFVANFLKNCNATFVYASFASFAAGAILSCAFFLLLFESTHLIASGWSKEVDQIWRWGTMVLLGLILPVLFGAIIDSIKPNEPPASIPDEENVKDGDTDQDSDTVTPFKSKGFSEKVRLIFAVAFGDLLHNLCDGFFVGAAFKDCSDSLAWSVTLATVLHEIPQELSDFMILTGPQVGLSKMMALVINFITGMSVLLGAVIVLASDVKESTTGLLLAFGGGVYLQIGCVECMPKMLDHSLSSKSKLSCVFAFIVGAVLIGLVLLDHKHCTSGEGGDGHSGHGH